MSRDYLAEAVNRRAWRAGETITPAKVRRPVPPVAEGRLAWCGPFAAAVLLRETYAAAYDRCRAQVARSTYAGARDRASVITGMLQRDLEAVLIGGGLKVAGRETFRGRGAMPGFKVPAYHRDPRPTLAAWLKTRDRSALYLVNVTGHYLVVAGDRTIDNQVGAWVSVRETRSRRARVVAAWRLEVAA